MIRLSTILIAVMLLLGLSFGVNADTTDNEYLSEMECELLAMINTARDNPLAAAGAIGMAPDKVLADLPWLTIFSPRDYLPLN